MKRCFLIILLGCSPFLLGRIQDWLMMNLLGVPLMLISVLMLLFWGYLSHVSLRMSNYDWKALLLLNQGNLAHIFVVLHSFFANLHHKTIGIHPQPHR